MSPKSYLNYGKERINKNHGTQSIDDLAKSPFVGLRTQADLVNRAALMDEAKSHTAKSEYRTQTSKFLANQGGTTFPGKNGKNVF